jgi:hypothetical protein
VGIGGAPLRQAYTDLVLFRIISVIIPAETEPTDNVFVRFCTNRRSLSILNSLKLWLVIDKQCKIATGDTAQLGDP